MNKELEVEDNKTYDAIIIIICLLYTVSTMINVNNFGEPLVADYKLHNKIVEGWLDGDNPLTDKIYFGNPFPYPPAFHLTIALFSKILTVSSIKIFNFIQILMFPMVLLSTYYLVKEIRGTYSATLTFLLLVSGFAFWDRAQQPIPNAVDVALMPIIILSYLKSNKRTFIALVTFLIYTHLFYSLILILGIFAYSITSKREKLKEFGYIALFCAPLFIFYATYIPDFIHFGTSMETQVGQYKLAVTKPLYNIAYYGYFLFGISIIGIVHFLRKSKSEFEKILLYWAAALAPLVILFPHRGLPFIAQPMAIVSAITLSDYVNTRGRGNMLVFSLLAIALLYMVVEFHNALPSFTSPFPIIERVLLYY